MAATSLTKSRPQRRKKAAAVAVAVDTSLSSASGVNRSTGESSFTDLWHTIHTPTKREMLKGYRGTVYACANLCAHALASTPLRLYVQTNQDDPAPRIPVRTITKECKDWLHENKQLQSRLSKAVDIHEVLDHPALTLLEQVNKEIDGYELCELTDLFQEILGTAYWWVPPSPLGIPAAIWVLAPQYVQRSSDRKTFAYNIAGTPLTIPAEEIIQFKFPNLEDPYGEGWSPLRAVWASISLIDGHYSFAKSMLDNRARPDVIAAAREGIGPDEVETVEAILNRKLRRNRNGGILVTGDDLRFQVLNVPTNELGMLQLHGISKVDIANAYGVPLSLLETKEVPRANVEGGLFQFAKFAVMPRCRRQEAKLTQDFASRYDPRLFFAYDNPVPEDRAAQTIVTRASLETGKTTINEERKKDGLEPVPWGDLPWLTNGVSQPLPDGSRPPPTINPFQPAPQPGIPPQEQQQPPAQTGAPKAAAAAAAAVGKTHGNGIVTSSPSLDASARNRLESEQDDLDDLDDLAVFSIEQASILYRYWTDDLSYSDALQAIKSTPHISNASAMCFLHRPKHAAPPTIHDHEHPPTPTQCHPKWHSPDQVLLVKSDGHNRSMPQGTHIETAMRTWFRKQKATILRRILTGHKAGIPSYSLFDMAEWTPEMSTYMRPLISDEYARAGRESLQRLGLPQDPRMWSIQLPYVKEAIANRTLFFCEATNATTSLSIQDAVERLRTELLAGIVQPNATIPELTRRVASIFDGAETWRARRIAVTEASHALHEAQKMVARASGLVKGFRWLCAPGACEECLDIQAESPVIGLDESFKGGVEFPPAHPNCYCTIVEVVEAEVTE